MTEHTIREITLDAPQVQRLISIAERWTLISRLASEINAMCDIKWEPLLLKTRDDTHRGVMRLVSLVHGAEPDANTLDLEQMSSSPVAPLVFGQTEAEQIGELARRAMLASRLLRPLLRQFPEESRMWWDARKVVDRLDFDGRELLGYVGLVDPDRAAGILAQLD